MRARARRLPRQVRTRLLWLLMRAVPLERRIAWAAGGPLRPLAPLLGRGHVSVLGGIGVRMLLEARAVAPGGAQAFPVLTGLHETQVQQALVRSAGPGDVVWDVGANVGFMSLVAARIVGPSGRVVAVEAEPGCAALVRRHPR